MSVDGRLIKGRPQIQSFYREMAASSAGQPQQAVSVEQIRFITSDLATVDGSSARLFPGFFATLDLQHIGNAAYNHDRGPVKFWAVRFHLEL